MSVFAAFLVSGALLFYRVQIFSEPVKRSIKNSTLSSRVFCGRSTPAYIIVQLELQCGQASLESCYCTLAVRRAVLRA